MKVYHYFALFDFDETIGKTFEPNKRGVDVTQAYKIACGQIFQCPVFEQVGGLKNGTPGELVRAILNTDKKDMLMTAALDYLDRECRDNLNGHVQLKADTDTSTVITELLIRVKLRLLMAQIYY